MKVVATSGAFQRQLPAAQGLQVALPKTAVFEGHERLQPVGELHIVTGVREVALSQIPPGRSSRCHIGGEQRRDPRGPSCEATIAAARYSEATYPAGACCAAMAANAGRAT